MKLCIPSVAIEQLRNFTPENQLLSKAVHHMKESEHLMLWLISKRNYKALESCNTAYNQIQSSGALTEKQANPQNTTNLSPDITMKAMFVSAAYILEPNRQKERILLQSIVSVYLQGKLCSTCISCKATNPRCSASVSPTTQLLSFHDHISYMKPTRFALTC